jgi:hypothetical protein
MKVIGFILNMHLSGTVRYCVRAPLQDHEREY